MAKIKTKFATSRTQFKIKSHKTMIFPSSTSFLKKTTYSLTAQLQKSKFHSFKKNLYKGITKTKLKRAQITNLFLLGCLYKQVNNRKMLTNRKIIYWVIFFWIQIQALLSKAWKAKQVNIFLHEKILW